MKLEYWYLFSDMFWDALKTMAMFYIIKMAVAVSPIKLGPIEKIVANA